LNYEALGGKQIFSSQIKGINSDCACQAGINFGIMAIHAWKEVISGRICYT